MVSRRGKAYLTLTLVFVLGAGTGGAAAFAFVQHRHAAMMRDDFGSASHRRMRVLSKRLDLDRAQEEAIHAILRREGEESFRLGEEMFDRCGEPLRSHRKKVDDEIRKVLRPDQIPRYEALAARGRFPGPPPFPGRNHPPVPPEPPPPPPPLP